MKTAQEYRSLVGALQYVSMTRPGIAYNVNIVSQFMHCSLDTHFKAVKRIIRYLKGEVWNDSKTFHTSILSGFI